MFLTSSKSLYPNKEDRFPYWPRVAVSVTCLYGDIRSVPAFIYPSYDHLLPTLLVNHIICDWPFLHPRQSYRHLFNHLYRHSVFEEPCAFSYTVIGTFNY